MTPTAIAQLLMASGVLCFLLALRVLIRQRRILEVVTNSNMTISLPTRWDDLEITQVLQRHSDNPAVLSHAISSIKTRMILGQDLKTAQQRLKLLASVIEVFKLNKEMQGLLHDLHLEEKEFEIKQIETQTRKEDAQAKLHSEVQLRELRRQRDELQIKKEISQLQQEIKNVETVPPPMPTEVKLTPEQQRSNDKVACEARIQSLKAEKQNALKLDDEQERILKVNAIDDALQREMERWAKLL
jgi:hypothetical protein